MINRQIVKNKIIYAKNKVAKNYKFDIATGKKLEKIIDFPFLQLIAKVKMGFFFGILY
jgi:hypothetical protein